MRSLHKGSGPGIRSKSIFCLPDAALRLHIFIIHPVKYDFMFGGKDEDSSDPTAEVSILGPTITLCGVRSI